MRSSREIRHEKPGIDMGSEERGMMRVFFFANDWNGYSSTWVPGY